MKSPTKIPTVLLLGGSRYYTKGIQAAQRAGFRVAVADRDSNASAARVADIFLPIDFANWEAIASAALKIRADAVVPLNDWGVLTAARVAAKLGLPGLPVSVAERSCNKEMMRHAWEAAGICCPRFAIANAPAEVADAVGRIGIPCILKPAHGIGGGSRGVIVISAGAEIDAAISFAQSFYDDKTLLVEQFVESEVEHSAEVLIHQGQPHVLAVADKIKSRLPYRVDRDVLYPTRVTGARRALLERTICESVRALGISMGAAHVELATTRDGCVLFELGARCGGGGTPDPIVRHVTGIDQLLETIRSHLGFEPRQMKATFYEKGCDYHFIFAKPGILREVRGVDKVLSMPGILDAAITVSPGGRIDPVRVGPDRAGFIIAAGDTVAEACDRARHAEEHLELIYEY